jgi:hypothetical protein
MFLLFLLFRFGYSSSIKTSESSAWISGLDPASADYVNHLYCGTVARGITYLTNNKQPVDRKGFEEGLAEIIRVYQSNSIHRPILNQIEVKLLNSQVMAVWKERGFKEAWKNRGRIYKLYKALFSMKTTRNRGISFALLLTDAKDKRELVHAEEIFQSHSFLKHVKEGSNDIECQLLVYNLQKSLKSREPANPADSDSEKNIQTATAEEPVVNNDIQPTSGNSLMPYQTDSSKMTQTAAAAENGVTSFLKTLNNLRKKKKLIDEAVDNIMEKAPKDAANRSEFKKELKNAFKTALESIDQSDIERVIQSARTNLINSMPIQSSIPGSPIQSIESSESHGNN